MQRLERRATVLPEALSMVDRVVVTFRTNKCP